MKAREREMSMLPTEEVKKVSKTSAWYEAF